MASDDIEREALLLSTSERARLAQKLLVSLESQSLLSDTWSQAWTEWVTENIPDPDPDHDDPDSTDGSSRVVKADPVVDNDEKPKTGS